MKLHYYLLIFLFVPYVLAQGIGISPSNIELSLLRGGENSAQFTIFNPTDHEIEFNIHNDKYPDWFEFEPNSGIISPGLKQDVEVNVEINSLIANGIYDSLIIIDVGTYNAKQGMALNIGTAIKTKIRVTGKQIINLGVGEVKINCSNSNEPVLFEFNIVNNGNVEVFPDVEITIKRGDYIIDAYKLKLDSISPGKKEKYNIAWDNVGVGDYKAQVLVKVGEGLIKKSINEFSISANEKVFGDVVVHNELIENEKTSPHLIGIIIMVSIVFIGFSIFLSLSSKKNI